MSNNIHIKSCYNVYIYVLCALYNDNVVLEYMILIPFASFIVFNFLGTA